MEILVGKLRSLPWEDFERILSENGISAVASSIRTDFNRAFVSCGAVAKEVGTEELPKTWDSLRQVSESDMTSPARTGFDGYFQVLLTTLQKSFPKIYDAIENHNYEVGNLESDHLELFNKKPTTEMNFVNLDALKFALNQCAIEDLELALMESTTAPVGAVLMPFLILHFGKDSEESNSRMYKTINENIAGQVFSLVKTKAVDNPDAAKDFEAMIDSLATALATKGEGEEETGYAATITALTTVFPMPTPEPAVVEEIEPAVLEKAASAEIGDDVAPQIETTDTKSIPEQLAAIEQEENKAAAKVEYRAVSELLGDELNLKTLGALALIWEFMEVNLTDALAKHPILKVLLEEQKA